MQNTYPDRIVHGRFRANLFHLNLLCKHDAPMLNPNPNAPALVPLQIVPGGTASGSGFPALAPSI
jgi:hypothetical protein